MVQYWIIILFRFFFSRFRLFYIFLWLSKTKYSSSIKGSDGGHNGLKNISKTLQTTKFARLKFGIGNNFYKGQQAEYVLEKWNDEEKQNLEKRIKQAVLSIESFCTNGVDLTMSMYNGK